MMFHKHVKFDVISLAILLSTGALITLATAPAAIAAGNPSGASVNLINALNDSVVVHCWSKESDLGATNLYPNANYYWSFHPNIFGRTVFNCLFLWRNERQQFAVWEGSYHSDREPCCSKGPCSYKICENGIYNALAVDTDYGPAESWEYYRPWMPNPEG